MYPMHSSTHQHRTLLHNFQGYLSIRTTTGIHNPSCNLQKTDMRHKREHCTTPATLLPVHEELKFASTGHRNYNKHRLCLHLVLSLEIVEQSLVEVIRDSVEERPQHPLTKLIVVEILHLLHHTQGAQGSAYVRTLLRVATSNSTQGRQVPHKSASSTDPSFPSGIEQVFSKSSASLDHIDVETVSMSDWFDPKFIRTTRTSRTKPAARFDKRPESDHSMVFNRRRPLRDTTLRISRRSTSCETPTLK